MHGLRLLAPTSRWGAARRALGALLAVSLASGTVLVPEAWADRWVATTGDDQSGTNDCTNAGTPCFTITHAVSQAGPGETVHVAAGTYQYNATPYQGEQFPIALKNGVSLVGAGSASTTVDATGSGAAWAFAGAGPHTPGPAGVTLSGFTVTAPGGGVNMVLSTACGATTTPSFAPVIQDNAITATGGTGVDLGMMLTAAACTGSFAPVVSGNTVAADSIGILLAIVGESSASAAGTADVSGNVVSAGLEGILFDGGAASGGSVTFASPTIRGNTVT